MDDINMRLLMHMLQMYNPKLAGTNWKQIAINMNQTTDTLKQVTTLHHILVPVIAFACLEHLHPRRYN